MNTLTLALRSLRNRRTTALLTLAAIAVSVALLLGVQKMRTAAREGFANTVSGVDLIVGARSGQLNLLLYSVFRVGDATANFQGFIPRKASWGVSLEREKFSLRANWSYQGRSRNGPVTGASIPAGTYNYTARRVFLDLLGEYNLTPRLGLYFTLRNVLDMPEQQEVDGPGVPQHATFRSAEFSGSLWTFGLRGTF